MELILTVGASAKLGLGASIFQSSAYFPAIRVIPVGHKRSSVVITQTNGGSQKVQ